MLINGMCCAHFASLSLCQTALAARTYWEVRHASGCHMSAPARTADDRVRSRFSPTSQ